MKSVFYKNLSAKDCAADFKHSKLVLGIVFFLICVAIILLRASAVITMYPLKYYSEEFWYIYDSLLGRLNFFTFVCIFLILFFLYALLMNKTAKLRQILTFDCDPEKYIETKKYLINGLNKNFFRKRRSAIVGKAYLYLGDTQNAWKQLSDLAAMDPYKVKNFDILSSLALFFFSIGNVDELRKYVNRMNELFTTSKNRTANAEIELRRGEAELAMLEERYDDAEHIINSYIYYPTLVRSCYVEGVFRLGIIAGIKKNKWDAVYYFKTVEKLGGKMRCAELARQRLNDLGV